MKFREIANGAFGRQFDRESKYPLPVALMVIATGKIGTRKKVSRPIGLRNKLTGLPLLATELRTSLFGSFVPSAESKV